MAQTPDGMNFPALRLGSEGSLEKSMAAAREVTQDLGPLEFSGTPGALGVQSGLWFPLLRDGQGNDIAAIGAGPRLRSIFLSHDGWFKKASWTNGNLSRFLDASLRWLVQGRKAPRVLCYDTGDLAERLRTRGWAVDTPRVFPQDLGGYDLVCTWLPKAWDGNFSKTSAEALAAYLKQGKPVLGAGLAWVFDSYGDGLRGLDIYTDYSANLVFGPLGLYSLPGYASSQVRPVAPVPGSHSLRVLFTEVNQALSGKLDRQEAFYGLPGQLFKQLSEVRDWQALVGNYAEVAPALHKALPRIIPRADRPLPQSAVAARTAIVQVDLMSLERPRDFQTLYGPELDFPGRTKPGSTPGTQTYRIDPSMPRWQSTGIWADPGQEIQVVLEGLVPGQAVQLRIGAHTDHLWGSSRPAWERWPGISQTYKVGPKGPAPGNGTFQTTLFSRFGGPLYIEIPPGLLDTWAPGPKPTVTLTASHVHPMAVGRPGSTAQELAQALAASPAPWFELAGRQVIHTLPTSAIPPGFDPAKVQGYWDQVMALTTELAGTPAKPWPQRMVADRQISSGYMHSGYPIMTYLDVASYVLGGVSDTPEWRGYDLFKTGAWGHFHELGHNHQESAWTFEGAGEVTVNLFTLYVMDHHLGIKPLAHPYLTRHQTTVRSYLKKPEWSLWVQEPFLALHTYAYLIDRFGWEPLKATIAAYLPMPQDKRPRTNQAKIDTWVTLWSQNTGHNLVPYFKQWAWPVSPSVEPGLKKLPVWTLGLTQGSGP